ncbi:7-deoxyloganetin glucosyltransferase [Zea mays]|uniref:Glycosyltransferase n=2 Tax=Zea mays TaxID=4577 RepID=A0A1D6QEB6_MAIZE|nr:7-deoxyloganetin glucosyltransferase [Zea mays]XP_035823354.1 7-deoxyloganetin glucosyltransferase [Zea mays]AQK56475.1 UDP-glycosyltransferase 85A7 [Zea mays]|eukprot:XP_008679295.1 7-deoxyloganetin glucosyltransferase [Zea mays]
MQGKTSMMGSNARPHAVLIPYPAQGHVTPLLQLAKVLHSRGFFVTYVNSEYNHRRLLRSRGADSLAGLDDFRFETIPDGLPPSGSDDDVTQDIPALCESLSRSGAAPFRDLLARLNGMPGRPPVTCVVLDNFMSFAQRVASEMGILAVVFCTMSACGFMGYLHFKELMDRGYVPLKDESYLTNGYLDTVLDWVPGMRGIRLRDMPSFIRTTDPDEFMVHFDSGEAQNARRAQGIIVNTFDALEQDVVGALRGVFPRVYTIGPLLTFARDMVRPDASAICGNLWKEDPSCLGWLDAQGPGSVVYVNFGSITVMTPAQLAEFAWGLANCGRPFLWVIRPDLVTGEKAMLPEEFYAETRERGLFLSWCPQEQVLSHPSTGLFLTHSGWNSTLESIRAGVPMICWPFFAEQTTNCRYACANWGIGLEIDNNVTRDEVARLIEEAMDGEKGKDMKAKATVWKEKAVAATESGGTSSVSIDRLVEFLLEGNVPTAAG